MIRVPSRIALMSISLPFAFADSVGDLGASFSQPPSEYSTVPFWVWNGEVTRQKIDRDLEAFRAQGIFEAIIHPRPGLITEYLSEEWFELCGYAKDRAEELGMRVWLYDENSFPSGFGGGHVARAMPESVAHPTTLVMAGGEGEPEDPDFTIDGTGFRLRRSEPNGWFGGDRYVDLLIPGVTETFIEVTMDGYESAFGGDFGGRVPGVFTDEPNIAPREKRGVRWTPSLFEDFERRWGYDLRPHLASLFEETGEWKRTRHHYYGLLLELFIERWSKPWHAYTEEKGLAWTGHYFEHGWPSPHHGGDSMAMYAWHQIPGIDLLFNNPAEKPQHFGNARAGRELASVANQLGRERTLSETYGAAGWDLDFEDMKRLGDWQYALGVNLTNQHLSFMDLKGRRKGDFPQSIFHHAPYWEDYDVLATYFHRLSFALTRGEQRNRILVFEPTTTAWMYYAPPSKESAEMERIESSFRGLLDRLEALQIGYDLASENIVDDHGRIEGGRWIVGERDYDLVILPPSMENLDQPTFKQLGEYLEGGGRLIVLGDPPERVDGAPSPDVGELFERHAGAFVRGSADSVEAALARAGWEQPGFEPHAPFDFGGQVHHMRRELKDGQLFFWVNFDADETAAVAFSASGGRAYRLDPLDGTIHRMAGVRENGSTRLSFELPPSGSLLCVVTDEPLDRAGGVSDPAEGDWSRVDAPTSIEARGPNSLSLDFLDLVVDGERHESVFFSKASDLAFGENGLEQYGKTGRNPWAVAVQYRRNILEMADAFGPDSGYVAEYGFELEGDFLPESLRAVIEYPQLYRISINGEEVEPIPDEWWLDREFGVVELGPGLKPGRNQLRLSVEPMHILAEVEPVILLGKFAARPADTGFVLGPPEVLDFGPWNAQGRPMFSGAVAYTKRFVPEEGRAYRVRLGEWNGTVARVKVNGGRQGVLAWPPHVLDLEGLEPGRENSVTVEVIGSLKNLLGPHHGDPTPGVVTPWSWLVDPGSPPPGGEYDLVDYGLFEDFTIERR